MPFSSIPCAKPAQAAEKLLQSASLEKSPVSPNNGRGIRPETPDTSKQNGLVTRHARSCYQRWSLLPKLPHQADGEEGHRLLVLNGPAPQESLACNSGQRRVQSREGSMNSRATKPILASLVCAVQVESVRGPLHCSHWPLKCIMLCKIVQSTGASQR